MAAEDSFDESRAEVFEALGHPTRIRILQSLGEGPLGFSELKRASGIQSNGLLTFHLGKLGPLVATTAEGSYSLTDEGREAVRILKTSGNVARASVLNLPGLPTPRARALVAGLLVALVLIGGFAVYSQFQTASLQRSLSLELSGATLLNGTAYRCVSVPLQSVSLPASFVVEGTSFQLTAPPAGAVFFAGGPPINFTVNLGVLPVTQNFTVRVLPAPNVQVRFADGQSENLLSFGSGFASPAGGGGHEVWLSFPAQVGPAFTHHLNPRAAMSIDWSTNTLGLCVSAASQ